jgi:phage baseplate assembly protein W
MDDSPLSVPLEIKKEGFARNGSIAEFARFLLSTEPGSFRPDPEFGCRLSLHHVSDSEDPVRDLRDHVTAQFHRYLGLEVKVEVSVRVENVWAQYHCTVTGITPSKERFQVSWEF